MIFGDEEEEKKERKNSSTAPETQYRSNEEAMSTDSSAMFPMSGEEVLR